MDHELNKNQGEGTDWLDDILGTSNTAKQLDASELAVQASELSPTEDTVLESILAEDWESVPDPEPEDMPVSLSPADIPSEENIFDDVAQMESLDISQDDQSENEADMIPVIDPEFIPPVPESQTAPEEEIAEEMTLEEISEEMELVEVTKKSAPQVSEDSPLEATMTVDDIMAEVLAEAKAEEATEKEAVSQDATVFFKPVSAEEAPKDAPAPQEEAKPSQEKLKERKVRPKMKKGYGLLGLPHVAATAIWLMIIVVIGLTIGNTLWVCITDLMAFGKPDRSITITITEAEVSTDATGNKTVDIDAIAQKLKDAGLIQYPEVFKFFAANLTDKYLDIDSGTFTLNCKLDYNALINSMVVREAPREEIDIMIPEGYTCAQIFKLLEEKKVCTVSQLEVAAANADLGDYWFLEGVERGNRYCLEGYLFPDTYRFYLNDEPVNVLKKFLDGFDYRFTDVMREKLDTIKERTGLDIGIREVVIIASMIEKETANGAESYEISAVIYNRLRNSANFPYLNIDATIVYYLNGNIDPVTGLSKPLTETQIYTDHPYNTYTRRGLPAGAISNPGRNSLDAALDPNQDTGYYYYVFNPQTGSHIFAKTLSEHEKNIRYVNSLK